MAGQQIAHFNLAFQAASTRQLEALHDSMSLIFPITLHRIPMSCEHLQVSKLAEPAWLGLCPIRVPFRSILRRRIWRTT